MIVRSFEASVIDGRLCFDESILDLEGRTVEVTVAVPQDGEALGFDAENPKVRYVRLVDMGPMKPCRIPPDLLDEGELFLDEI